MPRIRNVSDVAVSLNAIGGPEPFTASVDPDEVIEVPQDVFKAHEWPESIWHVVESRTNSKKED